MHYETRTGSTRIIRGVKPGILCFDYTDDWSVFDRGKHPQPIPTYGACRTVMAVRTFEHFHAQGIPTHFLKQVSATEMHVLEIEIPGVPSITGVTHGRHTFLEWLARYKLTGSLWDRYVAGIVTKKDLGFDEDVEVYKGMELPALWHDCSTKFEPADRIVSTEEALDISKLTAVQFDECQSLVGRAMRVERMAFAECGYDVPDGKKELAIGRNGKPMLIDVAGTIDENRIIHKATGALCSKDLIRTHPVIAAWKKKELDPAKEAYPGDKSTWPPYPRLPEEDIARFAAEFQAVTLDYTGVRIA